MTILLVIISVIVGLVAGLLRGGDVLRVLNTRLYHPEFLVSGIICALVVSLTDIDFDGVIAFVALTVLLIFSVLNLHLVGMVIISIGLALNILVFILNFGTPLRPNAIVEAQIRTAAEVESGVMVKGHGEIADDSSILPFLGDTFPIRWIQQVVSVGDLIILVGLANVTGNLSLGNQRKRYTKGEYFLTEAPSDPLVDEYAAALVGSGDDEYAKATQQTPDSLASDLMAFDRQHEELPPTMPHSPLDIDDDYIESKTVYPENYPMLQQYQPVEPVPAPAPAEPAFVEPDPPGSPQSAPPDHSSSETPTAQPDPGEDPNIDPPWTPAP